MVDGVTFHGPVNAARAAEFFSDADLCVTPSSFEAFGIVLLEGLAAGIPCVVRDVCVMPEIVGHGRPGGIVGDAGPHSLAESIAAALADDQLLLRVEAAAARARAHYSWDRAERQMLDAMAADFHMEAWPSG